MSNQFTYVGIIHNVCLNLANYINLPTDSTRIVWSKLYLSLPGNVRAKKGTEIPKQFLRFDLRHTELLEEDRNRVAG
jgi:hypothetical protein